MPQTLCGRVRRGMRASLCSVCPLTSTMSFANLRGGHGGTRREQDVVGLHGVGDGSIELGARPLRGDVGDCGIHRALFETAAHIGAEVVGVVTQVVQVYLCRFGKQDRAGYADGVVERGNRTLLDSRAETFKYTRRLLYGGSHLVVNGVVEVILRDADPATGRICPCQTAG